MTPPLPDVVRVGVSSCLLGELVRYDGGHKRDPVLADAFGPRVVWVPVCPEVESGFGTPREPMRLVREKGAIRLMTVETGRDLTTPLEQLSQRRVRELAALGISGYVFKSNSPSCGLQGVAVFGDGASAPSGDGRGLFAAHLTSVLPDLPVEEETRLWDPRVRDDFLERVFAYARDQGSGMGGR